MLTSGLLTFSPQAQAAGDSTMTTIETRLSEIEHRLDLVLGVLSQLVEALAEEDSQLQLTLDGEPSGSERQDGMPL